MKLCAALLIHLICVVNSATGNYSMRFYGNGVNDIDRVKIKIDNPSRPVDIRGSFTIEFWIKASHLQNNGIVYSQSNGDGWITGNVIIDRDIYGHGDWGDFGISIGRYTGGPANHRVVAFGIDRLGSGVTIRGVTNVADTLWHHIAVTRDSASGVVRIFVNGVLESSATGPQGDISYRDGRPTSWPNSDPYLVIGAEKHDAGSSYPSFNGFIDEFRISNIVRYTANFQRPNSPFVTDSYTVGLYHFDEGSGDSVYDVSNYTGGPSNGVRRFGGSPSGPVWSSQTPFSTTSAVMVTKEASVFRLYQNYPNPFNPITSIKFSVHEPSRVTLRVYDQLGREVITIIDNYLNAGLYEIDFHAQNLSSGLYFYELSASGSRQGKVMTLIK